MSHSCSLPCLKCILHYVIEVKAPTLSHHIQNKLLSVFESLVILIL